jgi:ribosome-binding factor A
VAHRRQRVEEEIQRQVSRILLENLQDRRMALLSVTAVRASPDLRHALVFLSILGSAVEVEHTLKVLDKARGFVRRELGSGMHLRRVPEIEFRLDEEVRRESRVEDILSRLRGSGSDGEE